jgi:hypothetical protein
MAEQVTRTDLSDLVRNRRIELGLSGRALHRRCIRPGDTEPAFGHEWLRKLEAADPSVKTPRLPYLEGLAEGLQVPLPVVQHAAVAQFMGIEPQQDAIWSKDRSIAVTVARMEQLSEADRAELAELAEVYTRRKLPAFQEPDSQ